MQQNTTTYRSLRVELNSDKAELEKRAEELSQSMAVAETPEEYIELARKYSLTQYKLQMTQTRISTWRVPYNQYQIVQ